MSADPQVDFSAAAIGAPNAGVEGEPDLERRFGGLRRLYGEAGYQRIRAASVAVVGLGGVGSWAVEALAPLAGGVLAITDSAPQAPASNRRAHQPVLLALRCHIKTPWPPG